MAKGHLPMLHPCTIVACNVTFLFVRRIKTPFLASSVGQAAFLGSKNLPQNCVIHDKFSAIKSA